MGASPDMETFLKLFFCLLRSSPGKLSILFFLLSSPEPNPFTFPPSPPVLLISPFFLSLYFPHVPQVHFTPCPTAVVVILAAAVTVVTGMFFDLSPFKPCQIGTISFTCEMKDCISSVLRDGMDATNGA